MKRIHEENINTPEHFDDIWKMDIHKFDCQRMQGFTDYIKPGDIVCDLGAGIYGFGEFYLYTGGNIELTCIDFSPEAQNCVLKRFPQINYKLCDVLNNNLPSAKFDIVGAGELIEHMERPEELVKEMVRLCKKGGLIIIGTVDPHCKDGKDLEYPEHLHEFTPQDLIDFLTPYGITEYKRVGNYDFVYCTCG